jgi:hypothetical protein
MDCQSNAKPSEKDHDLPGIRTWDLWISSQHTIPHRIFFHFSDKNLAWKHEFNKKNIHTFSKIRSDT